jgi:hypothetical protein
VKPSHQGWRALGLLSVLALAACGAAGGDAKKHSDSDGGSSNGGGSGASGAPGADPSSVCGTSKLGAPRLRRLSRDELNNTLADVFPAVNGAWFGCFRPEGF